MNDHGAEDEYVEVDMPSQPENTSDLTVNCVFHVTLLVFFFLIIPPKFGHVFVVFLPTHFPLSS